jgi:hypothetical protein
MAQSSTGCYPLEGGSGIRINHHDAAKTLDSPEMDAPGPP